MNLARKSVLNHELTVSVLNCELTMSVLNRELTVTQTSFVRCFRRLYSSVKLGIRLSCVVAIGREWCGPQPRDYVHGDLMIYLWQVSTVWTVL